jgi:hypothetical protein
MKKSNKIEINYIAPECNVIPVEMNAIMAGSNGDWQVHDGEVPGQGAKRGNNWTDDDEANNSDDYQWQDK